jgi:Fe-S cluster assembly protein SufD
MAEVADRIGNYLEQFAQFEKSPGVRSSWVHPLRQEAMQRFSERGFPDTEDEEWRFTSVAPILGTSFAPAPRVDDAAAALDRFRVGGASRLVFINGHYSKKHSSLESLPGGAIVGNLGEALEAHRGLVEPHLARYSRYQENPFAALNTAFLSEGAFVYVPKGSAVAAPIELLFLSRPGESPGVSHLRNLIIIETGSQARIVESYGGADVSTYFTNAVTEVVVGESANLDHYKLQRESQTAFHMATLQFHLDRNAALSTISISLGGGLVRNDINAVLDGEGCDLALNGLYAVEGEQHVDHHTLIDHAKPHGTSRELYKGILSDRSRGVFNGRIIVRKDAQKTDAKQTNRNLLLSDEALVNTNPQLEINADDVKCGHGATIGQLDADVLFYLRSRGIDLEAARHLLTYGFMSDISERIKVDAIRSELERVLFANLPGR